MNQVVLSAIISVWAATLNSVNGLPTEWNEWISTSHNNDFASLSTVNLEKDVNDFLDIFRNLENSFHPTVGISGHQLQNPDKVSNKPIIENNIVNPVIKKVTESDTTDAIETIGEFVNLFKKKGEITFGQLEENTAGLLKENIESVSKKLKDLICAISKSHHGLEDVTKLAAIYGDTLKKLDDKIQNKPKDQLSIVHIEKPTLIPLVHEECDYLINTIKKHCEQIHTVPCIEENVNLYSSYIDFAKLISSINEEWNNRKGKMILYIIPECKEDCMKKYVNHNKIQKYTVNLGPFNIFSGNNIKSTTPTLLTSPTVSTKKPPNLNIKSAPPSTQLTTTTKSIVENKKNNYSGSKTEFFLGKLSTLEPLKHFTKINTHKFTVTTINSTESKLTTTKIDEPKDILTTFQLPKSGITATSEQTINNNNATSISNTKPSVDCSSESTITSRNKISSTSSSEDFIDISVSTTSNSASINKTSEEPTLSPTPVDSTKTNITPITTYNEFVNSSEMTTEVLPTEILLSITKSTDNTTNLKVTTLITKNTTVDDSAITTQTLPDEIPSSDSPTNTSAVTKNQVVNTSTTKFPSSKILPDKTSPSNEKSTKHTIILAVTPTNIRPDSTGKSKTTTISTLTDKLSLIKTTTPTQIIINATTTSEPKDSKDESDQTTPTITKKIPTAFSTEDNTAPKSQRSSTIAPSTRTTVDFVYSLTNAKRNESSSELTTIISPSRTSSSRSESTDESRSNPLITTSTTAITTTEGEAITTQTAFNKLPSIEARTATTTTNSNFVNTRGTKIQSSKKPISSEEKMTTPSGTDNKFLEQDGSSSPRAAENTTRSNVQQDNAKSETTITPTPVTSPTPSTTNNNYVNECNSEMTTNILPDKSLLLNEKSTEQITNLVVTSTNLRTDTTEKFNTTIIPTLTDKFPLNTTTASKQNITNTTTTTELKDSKDESDQTTPTLTKKNPTAFSTGDNTTPKSQRFSTISPSTRTTADLVNKITNASTKLVPTLKNSEFENESSSELTTIIASSSTTSSRSESTDKSKTHPLVTTTTTTTITTNEGEAITTQTASDKLPSSETAMTASTTKTNFVNISSTKLQFVEKNSSSSPKVTENTTKSNGVSDNGKSRTTVTPNSVTSPTQNITNPTTVPLKYTTPKSHDRAVTSTQISVTDTTEFSRTAAESTITPTGMNNNLNSAGSTTIRTSTAERVTNQKVIDITSEKDVNQDKKGNVYISLPVNTTLPTRENLVTTAYTITPHLTNTESRRTSTTIENEKCIVTPLPKKIDSRLVIEPKSPLSAFFKENYHNASKHFVNVLISIFTPEESESTSRNIVQLLSYKNGNFHETYISSDQVPCWFLND